MPRYDSQLAGRTRLTRKGGARHCWWLALTAPRQEPYAAQPVTTVPALPGATPQSPVVTVPTGNPLQPQPR